MSHFQTKCLGLTLPPRRCNKSESGAEGKRFFSRLSLNKLNWHVEETKAIRVAGHLFNKVKRSSIPFSLPLYLSHADATHLSTTCAQNLCLRNIYSAFQFPGHNLLSSSFHCQTHSLPPSSPWDISHSHTSFQQWPQSMQLLAVYAEKNSPKHSYFFPPFPVIWWFVHVSELSWLEGCFVCQKQVLSVFTGSAAVLWCERSQLCRTRRYLDQHARPVYISHIVLSVCAYLMRIPMDHFTSIT